MFWFLLVASAVLCVLSVFVALSRGFRPQWVFLMIGAYLALSIAIIVGP